MQTQTQNKREATTSSGLNIASAENPKSACDQPDNKIKNTNTTETQIHEQQT